MTNQINSDFQIDMFQKCINVRNVYTFGKWIDKSHLVGTHWNMWVGLGKWVGLDTEH